MKRILSLLLILLLALCPARAEYWTDLTDRPVVCCEDRPGCHVLQTVMMGSFAQFDPDDSLSVRVFSAALPRLLAVEEDDFPHFSEQYGVDEQLLLELYHIALGNCLWADIILSPHVKDADEQNARIVLLLFLEPADGESVCSQRESIRAQADAQAYETIAEKAGVPLEFVLSLIAGEQQEALP